MDKIKLAQRTIALLSSMIENGECHTSRSREMKDNALNGLEQLRLGAVVGQSEQLPVSLIPEFGSDEWINCCKQMFGGKPKNG
jgi:hypothetical protein